MIVYYDEHDQAFWPTDPHDVYGIAIRGSGMVDFEKYPNVWKLTFEGIDGLDLHVVPKDRDYDMIEITGCWLPGTFDINTRFRKVVSLYMTGSKIEDPETFARYFEDVMVSEWTRSTPAMPVSSRCIVYNDISFAPKSIPAVLGVYRKCECINFQLHTDEDVTDMLRIYEEYDQLSPVMGIPDFFLTYATDTNAAWLFQLRFQTLDRSMYPNSFARKFPYVKEMFKGKPRLQQHDTTGESFLDWLENHPLNCHTQFNGGRHAIG